MKIYDSKESLAISISFGGFVREYISVRKSYLIFGSALRVWKRNDFKDGELATL